MNSKAFSLIELLVVMAIITILAAIAIPEYNKYKVNSFFSKMKTNLKLGEGWAEAIYADYNRYPNGICDASNVSGSGVLKCSYDSQNDTIITDSNGDLKVDAPLKLTFERKTCSNGTDGVEITVECPAGKCLGLGPSEGQNASIWIDTCENPQTLHTNTSLF